MPEHHDNTRPEIEQAAKILFNRLGRGDWDRVDEWRRQSFRLAATTLADAGLLATRPTEPGRPIIFTDDHEVCDQQLRAEREVIRAVSDDNGRLAAQLAEAAEALRAIGKAALVVKTTLDKPYADAPDQTPWKRFMEEPARRAYNLGVELSRKPFSEHARVEWNPTGDEWKPATVTYVGDRSISIRLDETGEILPVDTRHVRRALAASPAQEPAGEGR